MNFITSEENYELKEKCNKFEQNQVNIEKLLNDIGVEET